MISSPLLALTDASALTTLYLTIVYCPSVSDHPISTYERTSHLPTQKCIGIAHSVLLLIHSHCMVIMTHFFQPFTVSDTYDWLFTRSFTVLLYS